MTDITGLWGVALLAFVVGRLAEWRIHRKNYEAMRALGAEESSPWVMRGYYLVTVLVVPLAFAEQLWNPGLPAPSMIFLGALLSGVAILVRLWAIRSLGMQWTMSCLAVPGQRRSAAGPYKFLDNPEYLARLIEGSGICILLRAEIALALYVTKTAAYGVDLSGLETRQRERVDLRATPEVRS
jgi:methyltransferase